MKSEKNCYKKIQTINVKNIQNKNGQKKQVHREKHSN